MKIIFVGDRPSSYNFDQEIAFKGAKCERRLNNWIYLITKDEDEVQLINSHRKDFIGNIFRQRNKFNVRIVALGKQASKRMTQYGVKHFTLPHPSGLNRQVNDKKFIDKKLKECKKYIYGGEK